MKRKYLPHTFELWCIRSKQFKFENFFLDQKKKKKKEKEIVMEFVFFILKILRIAFYFIVVNVAFFLHKIISLYISVIPVSQRLQTW